MRACLRAVSLGTATGQQSQAWMIDERIDQGRDMAKAHLGVTCHLRCVHSPPPPLCTIKYNIISRTDALDVSTYPAMLMFSLTAYPWFALGCVHRTSMPTLLQRRT